MNPNVDFYFLKAKQWQREIQMLRSIVLETGLTEELKWGCPCYTNDDRNIVLIHTFKHYCALLFFKGALLTDRDGILIQQTRNVQSGRQMRFTDLSEVSELAPMIRSYINEAIEIEKSGAKVEFKAPAEFAMAKEFETQLKSNLKLKAAFEALTPGRQRAYLLYFSTAKQSKTKQARVEKCIPLILKGKGLND